MHAATLAILQLKIYKKHFVTDGIPDLHRKIPTSHLHLAIRHLLPFASIFYTHSQVYKNVFQIFAIRQNICT